MYKIIERMICFSYFTRMILNNDLSRNKTKFPMILQDKLVRVNFHLTHTTITTKNVKVVGRNKELFKKNTLLFFWRLVLLCTCFFTFLISYRKKQKIWKDSITQAYSKIRTIDLNEHSIQSINYEKRIFRSIRSFKASVNKKFPT